MSGVAILLIGLLLGFVIGATIVQLARPRGTPAPKPLETNGAWAELRERYHDN